MCIRDSNVKVKVAVKFIDNQTKATQVSQYELVLQKDCLLYTSKDDENNQKRLRDLENGQCLLQDLYGRVGVVQIPVSYTHLDVYKRQA